MKAKKIRRPTRVAPNDGLYEYVITLMGRNAGTREVRVHARTAEDAITIAKLNECRVRDFEGKPTEVIWSMRAV